MINPPEPTPTRQQWLQSLKTGDPVIVCFQDGVTLNSQVSETGDRVICVTGAGSNNPSGGRKQGRFSRKHGHRNTHSPYAQYWQTDFIVPVSDYECSTNEDESQEPQQYSCGTLDFSVGSRVVITNDYGRIALTLREMDLIASKWKSDRV